MRKLRPPLADDRDAHALLQVAVPDHRAEFLRRPHRAAIQLGDHVPRLNLLVRRRSILVDLHHEHSFARFQIQGFRRLRVERPHRHPNPRRRLRLGRGAPRRAHHRQPIDRQLTRGQVERQLLLAPVHVHADRLAHGLPAHQPLEIHHVANLLPVDPHDHVLSLEVRSPRRAVPQDPDHHHAFLHGNVGGSRVRRRTHGLDVHAEPGPREAPLLDQLPRHFLGQVHWHRESDARVQSADHRIDADHLALDVHQRPAAVSGVDARVGLQEILVHHLRIQHQPPPLRAHVPERHAMFQFEGRADRDREFPHPHLRRVAEPRHRQLRGVHLQHRDVRLRVHTRHLRLETPPVPESNLDLLGLLHHVAVRQDVAVLTEHDPRTLLRKIVRRHRTPRTAPLLFHALLKFLPHFLRKKPQHAGSRVPVEILPGPDPDDHDGRRDAFRDLDKGLVELANHVEGRGFGPGLEAQSRPTERYRQQPRPPTRPRVPAMHAGCLAALRRHGKGSLPFRVQGCAPGVGGSWTTRI